MLKNIIILVSLFVIFCIFYWLRLKTISQTEVIPKRSYIIQGRVAFIKQVSDNKWQLKIGQFWVEIDQFPQFRLGDSIQAIGSIEKRVINNFYSQFWLINSKVKLLTPTQSPKTWLINVFFLFQEKTGEFRNYLEQVSQRLLPHKESALLSGIVLGSQRQLPFDFWQSLKQSGTIHIIVASGMNVTIVAKVILDLSLKKLRRSLAIFVSLFAILIYVFLAGNEPPIVRAGLMGGSAFMAQVYGRQYGAGWALFSVSGLMLLVSPELLFQVGFQLSVVATAGLIFLSPMIGEIVEKIGVGKVEAIALERPGLSSALVFFRANLIETLAAQIMVLPLLLFHFGQFNLLTIIPNLLIAPLIAILMQLGGLLLLAGSLSLFLGQILAWVVWVPLRYMILVIEFFGQIKWLTLIWQWPWWLTIWWWIGLFFLVLTRKNK